MEDVVSAMTGALAFHEEDGDEHADRAPPRSPWPARPTSARRRAAAHRRRLEHADRADPRRADRRLLAARRSSRSSRSPNARNIATDAAVLLVLAVGSTYVIITAGIDLSVGAVLVFSRRRRRQGDERAWAARACGVILVGLAAALARRARPGASSTAS